MQVPIVEDQVNLIYPMGDYFSLQVGQDICGGGCGDSGHRCEFWEAASWRGKNFLAVVSATAPPVTRPFTAEPPWRWIGYQKSEEAEADFLADIAEKVYYIPMYKEPVEVSEKIQVVRGSAEGDHWRYEGRCTGDKCEQLSGGLRFILRESVSPKNLVPGFTDGWKPRSGKSADGDECAGLLCLW